MTKNKPEKQDKKSSKDKSSKIKYYDNAKVTCACGNTFHTGSTKEEIKVEICSMCHPFYTGTQKFVDTAGRVDKFRERMEKMKDFAKKQKSAKMTHNKSKLRSSNDKSNPKSQ